MATNPALAPSRAASQSTGRESSPLDALWHLFCSPKLAILLLLGIALASLAGSIVIQVPEGVKNSPSNYAQWLEEIQPKYGAAVTQVFNRLQIFDIFNAFWFKTLVLFLITNIVVCSINRWKSVWHTFTYKRVVMGNSYYTTGGDTLSFQYPAAQVAPDRALGSLEQALRRSRYRVLTESRDGTTYLYGDQYRVARLGTYATHLSIVLLLAGALAGGLGFRDSSFAVPEGSTQAVGHGTDLSLYLEDFTDEWYLNDSPKDYRSDVVLYDKGVEVRRGTIRVNDPLIYNDIRFHQSYYGNAVVMEVRNQEGTLIFNEPVPLSWRTKGQSKAEERPLGSFSVPGRDITVYALIASGPDDPLILPGQVLLEAYASSPANYPLYMETLDVKQPVVMGDLQFTFMRERQFTGLQVVQDPGAPLVWIGSFLLVLGNVLVLFFPLRQLWARSFVEGNQTVLEVRALAARDRELAQELQRLREALGKALGLSGHSDGPPQQSGKASVVAGVRGR